MSSSSSTASVACPLSFGAWFHIHGCTAGEMSSAHAAWVRTGAWGPCAHPALLRSSRVRRQKRCSMRVQVVGLETAHSILHHPASACRQGMQPNTSRMDPLNEPTRGPPE